MKTISIQHVYTVEGTYAEISEYRSELWQTYDEIDVISTPFDTRLVCTLPVEVQS